MNKENNLKETLQIIQLSEGEDLSFDEKAIEREYQRNSMGESTTAIKVMTVVGGYFAVLTFMAFVMATLKNPTGLITIGVVLLLGALWLIKAYDRLITYTISLSAYLAGFFLLMYGFGKLNVDADMISLACIAISIASIAITQNFILSFVSVLIINGNFLFLIMYHKAFNMIHLYNAIITIGLMFWILKEAKLITIDKRISRLYLPVRTGLVFSLLSGLSFVGIRGISNYMEIPANFIWVSSVVTISVTLYLIFIVLQILRIRDNRTKILIYSASTILLLLSWSSPAISGSLIIILLSFLVNYKTGFVVGITALIYFVPQYFYDLSISLLTKSFILISCGIIFLLFYLSTYKKPGNEKV